MVKVSDLRAKIDPVLRSWVGGDSQSADRDRSTPGLSLLAARARMAPRTLRRTLNQRDEVDWVTADRILTATGLQLAEVAPWEGPLYSTGISEDVLTVDDSWPYW